MGDYDKLLVQGVEHEEGCSGRLVRCLRLGNDQLFSVCAVHMATQLVKM